METQLYLSDLRAHEVRCSEGANGTFRIEGLPLLKPGTYNGIEFSDERLQSIADNFARSSEQLGFYPPLRPFHVKPGDRVDARTDILGNVTAVRVQDGVLLGDAVIYEPETVRRMQNGQYRYTSSEVRLNPAMVDGQDALVGVAYVDDPAVKGMPWQLVMNRAEYEPLSLGMGPYGAYDLRERLSALVRALPQYPMSDGVMGPWVEDFFEEFLVVEYGGKKYKHGYSVENGQVAIDESGQEVVQTWVALSAQKGAKPMSAFDKLKQALGLLPSVVAELEAERGEVTPTPEMVALRERAEAAEVALQAERDRAAAAATERTQAMVDGHLTALLSERYIVPAQQDGLRAIMLALGVAPQTVVLSEGTEPVGLIDALIANLRAGQQIDEKYFSRQSTPATDTKKTVEQYAAEIVAATKTS